ncbi:Rho termination factor N-terminal domain-containing protein [Thermophilibacter immobilis]|uniref:Rho termination factor N-terminal domain-containing protein n=1 Tax=Thermophilibacter immobilis TaxID=2779519 RepID=A0A7S7RUG4_9ACTN|nr:Rho termination factor N-terminal domain-containing protein [Thermophilibacter immobilis]
MHGHSPGVPVFSLSRGFLATKEKAEDLPDRTVAELCHRARELGLHGYSKLRRAELINLIRNS